MYGSYLAVGEFDLGLFICVFRAGEIWRERMGMCEHADCC
jgi:hypothetical protein